MKHKLYLYDNEKQIIMDLKARKYNFIQELFKVDKEKVMTALERVLKQETEEHLEISKAHKKELDKRLKSYKDNPDDVLDWKEVRRDW
ncbi:MAG TPA: addiction module protein [Flavobacteriaceae bacterium]|nr:addiction module protein [Flavobacteriaceae bacterium]